MARGDITYSTCPHCGGLIDLFGNDSVPFRPSYLILPDGDILVNPSGSLEFDGELDVASLTIGQTCQKYPASGYTIDGVYTGFEKETEVISEYPSRQEH